jgi:hypothetical protein
MGRVLVSTDSRNRRTANCKKCSETVRQSWHDCLERVRGHLRRRNSPKIAEMLAEMRTVIDSMPLASGEHAVARSRTENLNRYADACEWGAADFELRLLKVLA